MGEGRIRNPISVKYTLQEINLERMMVNVFHYLDGIVLGVESIRGYNLVVVENISIHLSLITE